MALEKAKLIVEKERGSETLHVQFNPAEYNLSGTVNYAEKNIPGFPGPITQFISGAASTLNLSLTFDTFDTPENGVRPVDSNKKVTDLKPHQPTPAELAIAAEEQRNLPCPWRVPIPKPKNNSLINLYTKIHKSKKISLFNTIPTWI